MAEAEPCPVPHAIGHNPMELVIGTLQDGLSLFEPVAYVGHEHVPVCHLLGDCCNSGLPRLIGADGWGIPTIHHPKWSVLQRGLVGGVVDVLDPRKPAKPLAWMVAGEAAEVRGDDVVGCLRLPIRCGWNAVVMWSFVPVSRMSSRQNVEVKTGSRSDTMDWGTP